MSDFDSEHLNFLRTLLIRSGLARDKAMNISLDDIEKVRNFLIDTNTTVRATQEVDKTTRNAIVIILYALVFVVSCVGNGLVVWAIWARKRMRTAVNFMIGNLTVSDLIMTIVNMPFSCARMLMSEWVFGSTLCTLVPFAQSLSVYVSSITMMVIAIDRYQVINELANFCVYDAALHRPGDNEAVGRSEPTQDHVDRNCCHLDCGWRVVVAECCLE